MLHPSTKRLIDKLSEMTSKQKVAWQEGENGAVTHDTEGYRVTLTSLPCSLILTDALGREIESCSPQDYADDQDGKGRPFSQFIEELYREAHRNARGAEKAISAVLAGLDNLPEETPAPEPEKNPPVAETEEAADLPPEETIEDPLDDSAPLDTDMYPELEGQSDITHAVASLADQVNGQHQVEFVDEPENAEPEAFAETEAVPMADPWVIEPEPVEFQASEELETTETEEDSPEPEMATLETEAEDLDEMPVEREEAPAELQPAPEPYVPAFMDSAADAPAYTRSEAVGSFDADPSEPTDFETIETAEAAEADESYEMPTEEAFNFSSDVEDDRQDALNETTSDHEEPMPDAAPPADEVPEPEEPSDPAPAPQTNFLRQGYFGSGYGSNLSAYRTESTAQPLEPDSEPAPTENPDAPVAEEAALGAEIPNRLASHDQKETEPEGEPVIDAPKSFSLSGITSGFGLSASGRSSKPEPDPQLDSDAAPVTDDFAAPLPEEPKIIDGTVDLQDWVQTEPEEAQTEDHMPEEAVTVAPDPEESDPAPAWTEPEEDQLASDDVIPDTTFDVEPAPVPETAQPVAEDTQEPDPTTEDAPPPKPAKRFNPWN